MLLVCNGEYYRYMYLKVLYLVMYLFLKVHVGGYLLEVGPDSGTREL